LAEDALRFTFRVLEPLMFHFWGETVIGNLEDPDSEEYLVEQVERLHLKYRRPKDAK
jgi:hypothetical protein